jgi:TM2 domain-containing membrane protein YozV
MSTPAITNAPYQPVPGIPTPILTPQQAWFYAAYQAQQKDELLGFLLAFFFGIFGIHHFYLGRTGWGVAYCLFFWTGIPAILGFIESFFMPGRIRRYNWDLQTYLLATMQLTPQLAPRDATQSATQSATQPATQYPTQPATLAAYSSNTPSSAQFLAIPTPTCPNCHTPLALGATFCAHCGSRP